MRNPARKIFFYLAMLMIGAALCALAISMVGPHGNDWRWALAGALGITLFLIGLVQMLFAMLHSRGEAKLRAGENIVARWSVSPDEWAKFRFFDQLRTATPGNYGNDLVVDEARPSLPVAIIVGQKSALIGNSYHVLRRGGIPSVYRLDWLGPPADPECLEFHLIYTRHRSVSVYKTLRVPVSNKDRGEASKVYDHFAPLLVGRSEVAVRKPGLTIGISLAVAAVGASAFAWGFPQLRTGNLQQIEPLLATIFGAIVATAALLLVSITAIIARRRS